MNKEQAEQARKVHAGFFDKTQKAIEEGYYLEAICQEYAAIEARTSKIMDSLGMPCGMPKKLKDWPNVPLTTRLRCLKYFLSDQDLFGKTYFDGPEEIDDVIKWIDDRNKRIHALYTDTEKYEDMIKANKKLAETGLFYAKTFYSERTRLKNLIAKKPELLDSKRIRCDKIYKSCKDLILYLDGLGIKKKTK